MGTKIIAGQPPGPGDLPPLPNLNDTVTKVGQNGRAIFSSDLRHRYWLDRWWGGGKGYAAFCLLNPSTADENLLDPTLRRCKGYAMAWGYAGMVITNLFSFRSTDPDGLKMACEPTGGVNNKKAILAAGALHGRLVCGWGAFPMAAGLAEEVAYELEVAGIELFCLGYSRNGSPRHPLYLRHDAKLLSIQEARSA